MELKTTIRIVLVEDNPADAYLVNRALVEQGIEFEMTWFADGDKALKAMADGEAPDLVLLDLNLAKTEGVNVLRAIRGSPKLSEVPVGILSSSESPADVKRTALLGANRFIKKPLALEDFMREVGQGVEEMLRLRESVAVSEDAR